MPFHVPLGPIRTATRPLPHTETIASTTSSRKRERLAIEPPYATVRWLLPSWRN
jgi:hypothetical protein